MTTERRSSTLAPFRHRIFLAVWIASLASNFGSLIQGVGASWLMTSIAPSADMVALVQASTALPIMLFSLIAGAAADVFDRRKVMIAAQGAMFLASAGLCVVTWTGLVTPWTLLAFTFAIGCGSALFGPAWQSSVGEMVPRSDLPAAVALNSLGFNIARTVGPAIGGFVVALAGASAAFLFNALTYTGLIAVLATWKREGPTGATLPRETMGAAMVAGVRYAALSPGLRRVFVRSVVFGLFSSAVWALMPLIARDLLGGGPLVYGLLLGAFGAGAVVAAFFATTLRDRFSSEAIVVAATLAFAVASLVAALSRSLPLTVLGLLAGGGGWVLALSTFNVIMQMSSPRWVVGRTMALYQTVTFGGMAAGSWGWGLLAHGEGLTEALALAAGGLALSVGLARIAPVSSDLSVNLDPHGRWSTPAVELDVRPSSGPIVVSIEYRVAPEDQTSFVTAMAALKRIRRRDGAHRWSLLRDLSEPDLWVERFQAATWTDYRRLFERSTVADFPVWSEVRSYHAGERPPRVRRFVERPPGRGALPGTEETRSGALTIDPALPPSGGGAAPPDAR